MSIFSQKRSPRWVDITFVAAAVMVPSVAWADTITYQEGAANALVASYAGTSDNTISDKVPVGTDLGDRNTGASGLILAGDRRSATAVGLPRRGLISFDLSSMAGQFGSISSATLTLTVVESSLQEDFNFSVYQISDANAGWAEGNSNGAAAAGESTWNSLAHDASASGTAWAGSAGLSTSGTDFVAAALDSDLYSVGDTGTVGDQNGTQIVLNLSGALIEQWINGVNAGLLIQSDDEGSNPPHLGQFASSENSTAAWRPQLEITFTPVPEPGALSLMGLGGLLILSRSRKLQK